MKKRIMEKIIRNNERANGAHAYGWKIQKIPFHSPEEVCHIRSILIGKDVKLIERRMKNYDNTYKRAD